MRLSEEAHSKQLKLCLHGMKMVFLSATPQCSHFSILLLVVFLLVLHLTIILVASLWYGISHFLESHKFRHIFIVVLPVGAGLGGGRF